MYRKILLIGLVFAGIGLAQKGGGRGGGSGDSSAGFGGSAAPTRFDNIAMTLNLNKDQKKTVKSILDEGAKEAAPLRDQISKSRIAVGEAIDAKKTDEELKDIARTSSNLSVQLMELELKTFTKVYGSLDDEQKKNSMSISRALGLMNGMYHTKNWNE